MEPKEDSIKMLEMRIRHQMNLSLEKNIKPENMKYYLSRSPLPWQEDRQQASYGHGSGGTWQPASAAAKEEPRQMIRVDGNGNLWKEISVDEDGDQRRSPYMNGSGDPYRSPYINESGDPYRSPYMNGSGDPYRSPYMNGSGDPYRSPYINENGDPYRSMQTDVNGGLSQSMQTGGNGALTRSIQTDVNGLFRGIQIGEPETAEQQYENQSFDSSEYIDKVGDLVQMIESAETSEPKDVQHARARSGYERVCQSLDTEQSPEPPKEHLLDAKG